MQSQERRSQDERCGCGHDVIPRRSTFELNLDFSPPPPLRASVPFLFFSPFEGDTIQILVYFLLPFFFFFLVGLIFISLFLFYFFYLLPIYHVFQERTSESGPPRQQGIMVKFPEGEFTPPPDALFNVISYVMILLRLLTD